MTLIKDNEGHVDAEMLRSWLDARSLSRGLPLSVEDRGAFRVDTGREDEFQRFVFARVGENITAVAKSISRPKILLKLSAERQALQSLVPSGWSVREPSWLMAREKWMDGQETVFPRDVRIKVAMEGTVIIAVIEGKGGKVLAKGRAVRHQGIFVYDQIETDAACRRQGMGTGIMKVLEREGRKSTDTQVLVATPEGRSLYESLGWSVVTEYCTAEIQ